MSQPAYSLRPNKAVDRLLLVEAIQRLAQIKDISEYTYYGLGGAYLEDFRILHEFSSELALVSIEDNAETFKRQEFHLPCSNVILRNTPFKTFVKAYTSQGEKSIFWLDYTRLVYGEVEDFMALLERVEPWSLVKITLRSEPRQFLRKQGSLRTKFSRILPGGVDDPPTSPSAFAHLIQRMVYNATLKALKNYPDKNFQPISSFVYSDSTTMFTLTGIVCSPSDQVAVRSKFQTWKFANLDWSPPTRISVPALSTKERLKLQSVLPCAQPEGPQLQAVLGYMLDGGGHKDKTHDQLTQYASFYKHYPYYMVTVP